MSTLTITSATCDVTGVETPVAQTGLASRLGKGLKTLDARWFQITFLASLLMFGAFARDFSLSLAQVMFTFLAALATQACWLHALNLPGKRQFNAYLSAVVSGFGLSILIRSDQLWVHPLLAVIAMSSKFVMRMGQGEARSHVLNPVNLAAFLAWAYVPHAWLSPGQWGSESLSALWFLALGGVVTGRVKRWDISVTLLFAWASLLVGRLVWYEYSQAQMYAIAVQQLSNGALLLFAFFMISDPMTTPHAQAARIMYAVMVACLAFCWQYLLFRPQGLIVALFVCSWTVPWINRFWGGKRFAWHQAATA